MDKSFAKNSLFNVGYKVLNVVFPLITSMYVSRVLGPDGTGRVAYAQNILSYFLVFASMGIPIYGIKEIARNSSNRRKINKAFSELFILNFTTTTLGIVTYITLVLTIPSFREDQSVFFAVGVSLFLNYLNIDWFYAGIEEYVYISIRSTIAKAFAIIIMFVFVRTRDDVVKYALISSVGLTANYILNIINARKRVALSFQELEFRRHLKPVGILLLTMLATDLYNQIDITMLGSKCSKAEIGYYSYAIKLVRIVTSIATAISATMLPRLSQYFNNREKSEFERFTNRVLSAVILLVVPSSVGVAMCSNSIILVLYGNEFKNTVPLICVLSPIILIISISYLCGSIVLTAINKEKYLLYATLAGACINITLNAILIPKYHGQGAAVASVIAEITVFALHYIFSKGNVNYCFATIDNLKVIIATITMAGIIIIIDFFNLKPAIVLVASICAGALTYFFVLYITRHELVLEGVKFLRKKFSGIAY